ncbi:hypothetical protein [Vannielia litorea]|uniref:hypothetical protein n=1 Tax=Vannielia litorea TaxID=1217970 RepID=UPI0011153BF1|nr:hypothetical protein [Vannielia litorea]
MRHFLIALALMVVGLVALPSPADAHDMAHGVECADCAWLSADVKGSGEHQCHHGSHGVTANLTGSTAAPTPMQLAGSTGRVTDSVTAPSHAPQTDLPPPRLQS